MTDWTGVSFVCPFCQMLCGWNEKRREYNATLIGRVKDREEWLQYAHKACVEKRNVRAV